MDAATMNRTRDTERGSRSRMCRGPEGRRCSALSGHGPSVSCARSEITASGDTRADERATEVVACSCVGLRDANAIRAAGEAESTRRRLSHTAEKFGKAQSIDFPFRTEKETYHGPTPTSSCKRMTVRTEVGHWRVRAMTVARYDNWLLRTGILGR